MGQSDRRSKARMGGQHRLLLLCSLMGFARSQTTTTVVGPTITPTPGCWYEALCAYSGIPQISIPSPQNADLDSRMAWCYNQCNNDVDCTDFTVFSTSRGHNCYLLANCDDKSTTESCLEQGSCNSDLRTVLPTTTVKSYNRHLQTRSLGSATTMSTLTNSKPQKGPSASSAAMAGWTAKRTKPQLCQNVWQDNGNPLKLYQLSLTHQKFWHSQALYPNQMMLPRLTADAQLWTWPGRTPLQRR